MKTKLKKVDAVLVGDIHLREEGDVPVCRTDAADYYKTQFIKLDFVGALAHKHQCPVLCPGDVFDYWKAPPSLIRMAIRCFRGMQEHVFTIPGQHDLPFHRLEKYNASGLAVVETSLSRSFVAVNSSGGIAQDFSIQGFAYGCPPAPYSLHDSLARRVAIIHHFTYPGAKVPWPGCKSPSALSLLRKMKGFDLVVSGDNHQSFEVRDGKRLLVNPGALMRTEVGQINYHPRVALWEAERNVVEWVEVPHQRGVVSLERADGKDGGYDKRMEIFVRRLKDDFEVGVSWDVNLRRYLANNRGKISRDVLAIIQEVTG